MKILNLKKKSRKRKRNERKTIQKTRKETNKTKERGKKGKTHRKQKTCLCAANGLVRPRAMPTPRRYVF
jgi:hypothetical protein